MGFTSIIGSGFLAAFALALGADNFQIGLLASIPFITQLLQVPAILLVEKIRRRKLITVTTWVLAQLFWFPIAAIPFFVPFPGYQAVALLLGIMIIRGLLAAVTSCGWNAWVIDLVPKNILGIFFARRSILTTIATVVFGLGGAFFVDYWSGGSERNAVQGYGYVIAFGALFMGMVSPLLMTLMPEPVMESPPSRGSLGQTILAPLRDKNFKWLLGFLFTWSLASNLALPFFSVYMLQKIGLSISTVIALYVLSQAFNIIFLRVWGPLIDKFGTKVILSLSTSLYLLVILGWIFVLMPDRYFLTLPLLIVLHIFAGIATAGVGLTTGTIGMKLSPRDQATAFLSGVSLSINIGSGLGPILGGLLANFFSQRHFLLTFSWTDPGYSMQISALSLTGFSFLFIIAFFLGLFTLSFLANLREEGEVSREVVLESMLNPARGPSQAVDPILHHNFPHYSFFIYKYIKRIPLPGLDVAMTVVAYEIANTARAAGKAGIWCWLNVRKVFRAPGPDAKRNPDDISH